jgi:hypothetical protein
MKKTFFDDNALELLRRFGAEEQDWTGTEKVPGGAIVPVSEETLFRLKAIMQPGETLSDVLRRIAKTPIM